MFITVSYKCFWYQFWRLRSKKIIVNRKLDLRKNYLELKLNLAIIETGIFSVIHEKARLIQFWIKSFVKFSSIYKFSSSKSYPIFGKNYILYEMFKFTNMTTLKYKIHKYSTFLGLCKFKNSTSHEATRPAHPKMSKFQKSANLVKTGGSYLFWKYTL